MDEGYWGTNADQSKNKEYCTFCFQHGEFTEPTLTVLQMINRSVDHMKTELLMEEQVARELAMAVIPHLKRWKS